MLPILIALAAPERKQPFRIILEDLMELQRSDNHTICNSLMNVSLTSTFIPPTLDPFFRQCKICSKLYHSQNRFSITVLNFPFFKSKVSRDSLFGRTLTSKILLSFNIFSTSFVTHKLKTSIISNAGCTS